MKAMKGQGAPRQWRGWSRLGSSPSEAGSRAVQESGKGGERPRAGWEEPVGSEGRGQLCPEAGSLSLPPQGRQESGALWAPTVSGLPLP